MVDDSGGGGHESGPASKPKSSFESFGGRQRFTVELRPGETTIVSWKKLLREATGSKPPRSNVPGSVGSGPSGAHVPASSVAPPPLVKHSSDSEAKDSQPQPGSNRLSTVIERIERMYAGNGSSDEEDVVLDNVPDEDEYDTEDSFIDDTELDDYFQVDSSTLKHDGFFVNRGKLERMEPTSLPNQQPKKRRRKDLAKDQGASDDGRNPNKHVKVGKKSGKAATIAEGNSINQSNALAVTNVHGDAHFQNQINASEVSVQRTGDIKAIIDPRGQHNDDHLKQEKDIEPQSTVVLAIKSQGSKLKESSEFSDTMSQKSIDKNIYSQSNCQSGEVDQTIGRKEKSSIHERIDLNVPASKISLQPARMPLLQRKEASTVRPKMTMLEKAIRELEKIVAESRPPSLEVQDADNSSQAVKRRLPPEIKQKLAKVARLAQASQGKISKELLNRLMSIVGHLIQLRTLKRNLKIMINMGLSAKQEKDDRVQQIKKEVAEMIKLRVPLMKPKEHERHAGNSDDFQEPGPEEKEALKRKYTLDDSLEDKICDLYELYVEGLEEDIGPPVRKLYAELAALWPNGSMDNHGIKRAICRAKDRRRALCNRRKDQDKLKKKMLVPKTEETVRGEASSITQPLHIQEKSVPVSRDLSAINKSVPGATVANAATTRVPVIFANGPNMERSKQEKLKAHVSDSFDARTEDMQPKRKIKRKTETKFNEGQFHVEKLSSGQVDERQKHQKQVSIPPAKPNLNPAAPPSFEQLS